MKKVLSNHPNRIAALPRGKKHWNWSESPNILSLHKRIHRKYGSAKNYLCAKKCGKHAKDWALKKGRKYTDKRSDYEPLCRGCHIKQDKHWSKVDRTHHRIIRDSKGRIKTTILVSPSNKIPHVLPE